MRLILFAISAIALLMVAALVGPSFVDWNKYKPQIIEQVKNATGLEVKVDGDLSMAILPSPRIKIEKLTVVAPNKVKFENLLEMKSAEVSVQLAPLMNKQIAVDSVTLVDPIIQVEKMQDGTPSWQTEKLGGAKKTADAVTEAAPQEMQQAASDAKSKAMDSISLNKLKIENGSLAYIDHQTGAAHSAKEVNIDLKANSLKGPFIGQGSLVYDSKKISFDVETGKMPAPGDVLKINAELGLPDAGATISFGGVANVQQPFEVQGQTNIKAASLRKLMAVGGNDPGAAYDRSLGLDGLVSANESKVAIDDVKLSFGDFVGNGKLAIGNMKAKDPMTVSGFIKSSSVLDLDMFSAGQKQNDKSSSESADLKQAGTGKKSADKKGLVPNSLTLPMPLTVDFKMDLGGVKLNKNQIKGVFVDLKQDGPKANIAFKTLELPGQGVAEGVMQIAYGSSSQSPKTGQVVYTDPNVSYTVDGQVGQLAPFLAAFAPEADTSAITKLYNSAQFNLKGSVNNSAISLKDSVVKLDQMVVGLAGSYQPAFSGGRAKAVIDVSAGSVDFDQIKAAQGGKKSAPVAPVDNATGAAKPSAKEALKPVQDLSLPMDVAFDISLQKARVNGADIEGVRLTGDITGKKLTLKNASANNYAGAAISAKGLVGNLSDLSGLDLEIYTKTQDVQKLAQAFKVDTSKLPKELNALEATVIGKGAIDNLVFSSNIKSMGGQLEAAGNAANILDKPAFDNLSVRLKHPNLVKAIQIVNPGFSGATGLQQAVDFYTKASSSGKVYTLTDMKVTLGATNFGGNLKIDTSNKIHSIRGAIQAGKIAVDDLVGAKSSGGSSGGGSGGSSGGTSGGGSSSGGGKWSTSPINLGWMKTVDVDVALAASSITYGKWNFTEPSTDLKIANGVLKIDSMKAGVFGGQANLSTQVNAEPVSLSINTAMNDIDMESLVKAISSSNKLNSKGKVTFTMDASGAGGSAYALISAMNGKAALNGTNIILEGFDLAKLARGLAVEDKLATSFTSLIDGAMSGGETQFDTVKGDYVIQNGVANITKMAMDGPSALITTTGYADFPKWYVNLDNLITLKNVPDLEPFEVKIKGPLNNPTDTFGKNVLEDYLQQKLKRKLVKELPDVLGEDVTEKLQKFGILPQKQAPAPTPAPATPPADESSWGAPADSAPTPEAAPAPEPAPVPEEPKDPLQQLLENPEEPEKAIKGVLDGLLR